MRVSSPHHCAGASASLRRCKRSTDIERISVTREVLHFEMSPLKLEAYANLPGADGEYFSRGAGDSSRQLSIDKRCTDMTFMFVTLEVSHSEMSPLKLQ